MNWTALAFLFFILSDWLPPVCTSLALWKWRKVPIAQLGITGVSIQDVAFHFWTVTAPRGLCKALTVACLIKAL